MIEAKFKRVDNNNYHLAGNSYEDHGIFLVYKLIQGYAHPIFREYLLKELTDVTSEGFRGEIVIVDFVGDRVSLYFKFDENPDNPERFELDRTHLLDLIAKWDALSARDVPEVVIRRDGERFEIEEVK